MSYAAQNGHGAVVKLLVNMKGIDVNSMSRDGYSPLAWAAQNGHEKVVQLLLNMKGIDVDSEDRLLSWVAKKGTKE